MSDKPLPRPSQATLGGWMIVVGSVTMVLLAFQRMSTLGSLDFQESVAKALGEPPADGLGLSVDDVQSAVRVLCFVVAACAVAAAILGREVFRASTSARLALSVLAPVIFVAGFAVATLPGAFVASGVVLLWTQPTRDWFAGRTPPAAPAIGAPSVAAPTSAPTAPPVSAGPCPGYPGRPAPQAAPGPHGSPYGAARAATPVGERRPGPVTAACVVTWVTCGLAAVGGLLFLLVVVLAQDTLLDDLRRNGSLTDAGVSDHAFVVAAAVLLALVVVWALAAAVVAVFAARRAPWAGVTLLVSAAVAGVLCLVAMLFGGLVAIVPLAACAATTSLLLRPESRTWFRRLA